METIDIDGALELLNNATGKLALSRHEHIQIQVALDVLKETAAQYKMLVLEKNSKPKVAEEPKKPLDTAEKALS